MVQPVPSGSLAVLHRLCWFYPLTKLTKLFTIVIIQYLSFAYKNGIKFMYGKIPLNFLSTFLRIYRYYIEFVLNYIIFIKLNCKQNNECLFLLLSTVQHLNSTETISSKNVCT